MEIFEKAAKAIYESRNGAGAKPWSKLTKSHRGEYARDALAAWEVFSNYQRRKALEALEYNLNFIGSINRSYDDSFGKSDAKIGDTLKA